MIIGVLVGPTVVSCFNSDENLGMCLRGKMTEAGLFPQQATALADPAAPEAPDEPSTEADAVADLQAPDSSTETTAVGEPALDVTSAPAADEPAGSDELVAATFGLLRAEPDGSVVIAGSGTPGTEVEVYADETLLGTATVERSGDWVLVPDEPVPTGGVEITLAEAGKQGRAAESFVVVIDEDRSGDPLVVASTPGQASEILQGLEPPERMDVATAEPAATRPAPEAPAASQPPAEAAKGEDDTDAPASTPVATAAPQQPASAQPDAAPAPESSADSANVEPAADPVAPSAPEEQPAEPADVAEQTLPDQPAPAASSTEGTSEGTEPPAAVVASSTADTPADAAASDEATAAPDAASTVPATTPAADAPATPPTIDAIEVEEGRTFFAGGGPEGATMRLYVDDTFVSDAVVEGGRWLVEAGNVLTKAEQRVRVDMLAAGSADVAARAEVNFVIDLPEEGAPTAIATADVPASPTPAAEPATPAAGATVPAESPVEPTAQPESTPAATAADAGPQPAAPAAPDTQPAAEPATSATKPAPLTPTTEPAAPEAEPSAAPAPAEEPAPATAPEAAAPDADIPTLVAVSVGGPDAERFAAGKAIIRRGDNLWTIARRVYGEGIKYTTIYEANTGQIRDPDRIYPGQVFDLPAGEN